MNVTEHEAFQLGFLTKIAESRLDPLDMNDVLAYADMTKQASLPLMLTAAGGVALPLLLKALIDGTINIPGSVGSLAGAQAAELSAEAKDPSVNQVAKEKIIRDYENQAEKLKIKKNNRLISEITKDN